MCGVVNGLYCEFDIVYCCGYGVFGGFCFGVCFCDGMVGGLLVGGIGLYVDIVDFGVCRLIGCVVGCCIRGVVYDIWYCFGLCVEY